MATGLLVLGVGRATRLLRFMADFSKVYEGTGMLGIETTTLDAEGEVVAQRPVTVEEPELLSAMETFVGDIEQVPPAYSAVKVGGEKLYRAARAGRQVEAPARRVKVSAFELLVFESSAFGFRVRCSGGTYVRSLVADIGTKLLCGAHLVALRRTAIGPFQGADAGSPDDPGPLLPLELAVAHLPDLSLTAEEAIAATHGTILGPAGISGPYRVLAPDGRLIAIYLDQGSKATPEVVLSPS